jgi:predicted metal-binding protein
MVLDTWDRLVALVPPPSNSVVGRKIEAATGTLLKVKSVLTQAGVLFLYAPAWVSGSCSVCDSRFCVLHTALSRCMTREQQQKIDAKFSKPKVSSGHRIVPYCPHAKELEVDG